jgi:hypothetical protein
MLSHKSILGGHDEPETLFALVDGHHFALRDNSRRSLGTECRQQTAGIEARPNLRHWQRSNGACCSPACPGG